MNPIEKFRVIEDPIVDLKCKIGVCNHVAINVVKLYSHYRVFHSKDKKFASGCLYSKQCFHKTEFKTFWGLNSHLRKYHSTFFEASFCDKDTSANYDDESVLLAAEPNDNQNEPIIGKNFLSDLIIIEFNKPLCNLDDDGQPETTVSPVCESVIPENPG